MANVSFTLNGKGVRTLLKSPVFVEDLRRRAVSMSSTASGGLTEHEGDLVVVAGVGRFRARASVVRVGGFFREAQDRLLAVVLRSAR